MGALFGVELAPHNRWAGAKVCAIAGRPISTPVSRSSSIWSISDRGHVRFSRQTSAVGPDRLRDNFERDGKTYEHDVIIRLSGEVVKRKKKLSKKHYGTSHVVSKEEAKFVFEQGCEQIILGSGQEGNVQLSPEAEAYFAKKGCKVLLQPTPEAIRVFNRSHAKKIGLFHVIPTPAD